MKRKNPSTTAVRFLIATALCLLCTFGCKRQVADQPVSSRGVAAGWVLNDSAPYNLTTLDPISIVDAFTINVLANVYEGLVTTAPDGKIVPALAESWDVTDEGRTYTFHLRTNAIFRVHPDYPKAKELTRPVTAADVVCSLNRMAFGKGSTYWWVLRGLLRDVGPINFDSGERHPDIVAIDSHTVQIKLVRPFPLLYRLAMVAGWVYPAEIATHDPAALSRHTFGTGPYRLERFVPDDHIKLVRASGSETDPGGGPADVRIRIMPDALAALEAFRRGEVDCVELDLGTIRQGRELAERGHGVLKSVTANYLDYIVIRNDQPPFDDVRVRQALNLAVDRDSLCRTLSGLAAPAFGFIPPPSPAYRGEDQMRARGFGYDPSRARALLGEYLSEKGSNSLTIDLVIDAGELPDTIGQYVQAQWQMNLPQLHVNLKRITWPELLQRAFSGAGVCYRFWWNIVSPGEDIYFLFYFPGQEPPNGFNLSFYTSRDFEQAYYDAFSILEPGERMKRVGELEDLMIRDAAAVPLLHRRFVFLVRPGLEVPINGFLRKYYALATKHESASKPKS